MSEAPIVNIQEKPSSGSDSSILAAMLANRGPNDNGFNSVWPLLALAGGRGLFGGRGDEGVAASLAEVTAAASITSAKDAVAATAASKDHLSAQHSATQREIAAIGARHQESISDVKNTQLMTALRAENLIQSESCATRAEITDKFGAVMRRLDHMDARRLEEVNAELRNRISQIEQTEQIRRAVTNIVRNATDNTP